jgi:hypothetical protein
MISLVSDVPDMNGAPPPEKPRTTAVFPENMSGKDESKGKAEKSALNGSKYSGKVDVLDALK